MEIEQEGLVGFFGCIQKLCACFADVSHGVAGVIAVGVEFTVVAERIAAGFYLFYATGGRTILEAVAKSDGKRVFIPITFVVNRPARACNTGLYVFITHVIKFFPRQIRILLITMDKIFGESPVRVSHPVNWIGVDGA